MVIVRTHSNSYLCKARVKWKWKYNILAKSRMGGQTSNAPSLKFGISRRTSPHSIVICMWRWQSLVVEHVDVQVVCFSLLSSRAKTFYRSNQTCNIFPDSPNGAPRRDVASRGVWWWWGGRHFFPAANIFLKFTFKQALLPTFWEHVNWSENNSEIEIEATTPPPTKKKKSEFSMLFGEINFFLFFLACQDFLYKVLPPPLYVPKIVGIYQRNVFPFSSLIKDDLWVKNNVRHVIEDRLNGTKPILK